MKSLESAVKVLGSRAALRPEIGIILGTGLSSLAEKIEVETSIPYGEIPGFPVSTVEGHAGNLVLGRISGRPVAVFQGRFHLYEGYSPQQIAFPIRALKAFGVNVLLESNAAGGLNPAYQVGDLVLITDHINLQGFNPLVGPNDENIGPRFPDMSEPYDRLLLDLARQTALREGIQLREGVYVGVLGPNLETRAEYRFLRMIGADLVGMSTVPEVIAAVHAGMRVFGVSVVTDRCLPDALKPVTFDEILAAAGKAEPSLTRLFLKLIESI
ncbi:MAG TPA: purine-nucleoside phosphorylase [bacterium]|nr:purine-nucleoside phosphorylase [bacterium]HNS48065.1 purine-nucleoside phosphorylase [bacterium]